MTLVANDVDFLREIIAEGSGNVISSNQSYLLEARLAPVAQKVGLADVNALVKELRGNPRSPLRNQVTEAMTINETSFFRDVQPFEALKSDVLPELLKSRSNTKSLSVWSAASSSGQEPYSLAILMRQHFPELANWKVRILATDLSDEMVQRTKEGVYSQFEVNRGLPAPLLVRAFDRRGTQWQAKPELRRMIDARKMN